MDTRAKRQELGSRMLDMSGVCVDSCSQLWALRVSGLITDLWSVLRGQIQLSLGSAALLDAWVQMANASMRPWLDVLCTLYGRCLGAGTID